MSSYSKFALKHEVILLQFLLTTLKFCQTHAFLGEKVNKTAGYHRHIFRRNTNILINICPQLKTRLLFKIKFAKVFYKHQFRHWFLYSMQKRGITTFRSNFLSHSAKNFRRGESFSVSLISGIEKFYATEGYVTIFDFLSKFFCLTVPKKLVGEPFCAVFQKISGSEKVYG